MLYIHKFELRKNCLGKEKLEKFIETNITFSKLPDQTQLIIYAIQLNQETIREVPRAFGQLSSLALQAW